MGNINSSSQQENSSPQENCPVFDEKTIEDIKEALNSLKTKADNLGKQDPFQVEDTKNIINDMIEQIKNISVDFKEKISPESWRLLNGIYFSLKSLRDHWDSENKRLSIHPLARNRPRTIPGYEYRPSEVIQEISENIKSLLDNFEKCYSKHREPPVDISY